MRINKEILQNTPKKKVVRHTIKLEWDKESREVLIFLACFIGCIWAIFALVTVNIVSGKERQYWADICTKVIYPDKPTYTFQSKGFGGAGTKWSCKNIETNAIQAL